MPKLEKSLKEWVAFGFIDRDQEKLISDHESNKAEKSWILSGLLFLGVVIIGIGIISLIAANWERTPITVKLFSNFGLLMALALAIIRCHNYKMALQFEVLLFFFLITNLASIGLITQIYHTEGEIYQTLMLWSLITFLAAMAAKKPFVPFVWTGIFFVSIVLMALDSVAQQVIFYNNEFAVFMTIPLLSAGLAIVSKELAGEIVSTRAFRSWTLISALIALALLEFNSSITVQNNKILISYLPGYILAFFNLLAILKNRKYQRIQKGLLQLTLLIFLLDFHLPLMGIKNSFIYAIFTLILLALTAVFLAALKDRRVFQCFLFFIGLRFLILYFQAIGGLTTTGLGLIISGALVIAMAVLWNKYRTSLALWTERWMQ